MRLEGKVAFVTGASRGIGAAVARALVEEGASVGLASRSGDDLGLRNALGVTCDVRDLAQVESAVEQTVARFGRLDICVANAGVGSYHPLVDTPVEHLEQMIDVNLKGTIYAARACIPHLVASGAGDRVHPRKVRAPLDRLPGNPWARASATDSATENRPPGCVHRG